MPNVLRGLTISVALLAGIASLGGLTIPHLYRDAAIYKAAWQANDFITTLLTPAVLISYHYFRRGIADALLIWLGLMLYLFYNYAFYLFGAAFNWFFIVYAALVTLTLYALLAGLREIDRTATPARYASPATRRWTVAFLSLLVIPLAWVELGQYRAFILTGRTPEIPTLIIALDLTLVIPNMLLAAYLLAGKRPWGIILTAMMLVKSFTYGLVLVTGASFIAITGIGPWDPLLPYYIFVSVGGLLFLLNLLKDLNRQSTRN